MRISTRRKLVSLVLVAVCTACIGGCRRQPAASNGSNGTAETESEYNTPEPDAAPPARPVEPEEEWRDEPEPQPEPEPEPRPEPRPEPDEPQAAPEPQPGEPEDDWNDDWSNEWQNQSRVELQDSKATATMESEDSWGWEQEPATDANGEWQEWGADEEVWGESEYEQSPSNE